MVTLGVGLAALAVILTSVWFMNRPPVSTPSQTETAPQVQPPPTTTTPPSALDPPEPNRTNRAPVEEELIAIRSTARRQIAGGERQAALETLTRGLALDPKDPQINAVLDDLVAGARRAAVEARTAATRRGERSSGVFQDAQAREREADTFTRAGDRVSAVQAFWSAASRYNQVPESPGQKAAAPSRAEAPRAAAPAPQPAPIEPPLPEPRNTQSPSTLPLKPSPAAPLPAPQTPELPRTQRDPAPDPVAAQIEAVRDTLRRYTQAYQSLNSAAVGAVMPGLTSEQLRNLDRDFSNYRSYTVDIRDARIAVAGETATVACQVVRSFETKNGVAGNHTVPTVFHLRRVGARWMIERLESR
jgi:hypothetical protein